VELKFVLQGRRAAHLGISGAIKVAAAPVHPRRRTPPSESVVLDAVIPLKDNDSDKESQNH
jgi:hypothetical protein